MGTKLVPLTLRLLLAVLFASFLSPGFAWHKLAGHGAFDHADLVAAVDEPGHVHHGDGYAHEHDAAAHSQIGHLLGHLPVVTVDIALAFPPATASATYPPRCCVFPQADPEPPYKPPRSFLFV